MRKPDIFLRLIITDLKRLKNYIWQIFAAVLILLTVCASAGIIISKYIYKEDAFQTIRIAYYIPEDDDIKYNRLAIGMLKDMQSMQEIAELVQTSTIEEGYSLLERGDILYFIIVPERFFSGIMDSTNPPLDIVVKDNETISAYIANELFLSYAKYLGIAQAGIYSMLDTVRNHDLDSERIYELQDRVNLIYLNRALNKDGYIEHIEATNEGVYTLEQHYIASALMLSLFFTAFVLMPFLQGYNNGITTSLSVVKINSIHIMASRTISMLAAVYASYIPCFLAISIYGGHFNHSGLVTAFPAVFAIAAIIAIISTLSKNVFTGNMLILTLTVAIAYVGGGIAPTATLPSAIQTISNYLPGKYIINCLSQALYG